MGARGAQRPKTAVSGQFTENPPDHGPGGVALKPQRVAIQAFHPARKVPRCLRLLRLSWL
jgi:hypothetical protein